MLPAENVIVELGRRRIAGLSRTFQDVAALQPDGLPLVALMGSNGYLEIAVRDGNAAQALNLGVGATARVIPAGN